MARGPGGHGAEGGDLNKHDKFEEAYNNEEPPDYGGHDCQGV